MRVHRFRAVLIVFLAALVAPLFSYGAAQLAAGAKTSAQPTSTNPQQRQLQITFDPECEHEDHEDEDGHIPSFNVTSFQLSVQFDSQYLTALPPVQFVGPYSQTPPITGFSTQSNVPPPGGSATGAVIDQANGLISFIAGSAPVGNTQPGDVDIFLVNFQLKDGVSLDQLLHITIFADGSNNDFIKGTDPVTGDIAVSNASAVTPTTLTGSFNDFAAAVPLPSTARTGLVLGGLLLVGRFASRRWAGRRAVVAGN